MSVSVTERANANLIRLTPAKWYDKLVAYQAKKVTKKATSAAATAAEKDFKAARGEILRELGTAKAAVCKDLVISVTETANADPSINIGGTTFKLTDVTSIVIGNTQYKGSEIVSVYGGRAGSTDVEVSGG
jgi:hypothetical protein